MSDEKIQSVVITLSQIESDSSVPKNVRTHVKNAIIALQENSNLPEVKINKALEELGEVDKDTNINPYTRTQIWNIVSVLECK